MRQEAKQLLTLAIALTILIPFVYTSACQPNSEAQVTIHRKDGDSCLVDHKCKIVVRRWEKGGGAWEGGNVYYQCLVSDQFYNVVGLEEKTIVDLTARNCDKINP